MNVGTLTIEIAANVARLQADMDATKRAVNGAMKDVEQYVGFAKTAFVALSGVTGVASFAGLISSSISAKARLQDLSLQTGMSVESLSSLQKVGKFSGTALEEITGASNKLSKALATSNEDSKGAALAIEALGLNFDKFKQLSADERLLAVAKAMEQFKDGTGKTSAAMLLFGKAGAEMMPFMKELVERQGLVGSTTTSAAKAAKEYEDNIVALRTSMTEWAELLVNDVMPPLVGVTNQLLDGRKAYGSWWALMVDNMSQNPFEGMESRLTKTRESLSGMRGDLVKMQERSKGTSLWDRFNSIGSERNEGKLNNEIAELAKRDAFLKSVQSREALALGGGVRDTRHAPPSAAQRELNIYADRLEREKKAVAEHLRLEKELAAEAKKRAQEFAALIGPMREKLALDQTEIDLGRALTAGERDALDVMVQLRDGKLQLTDARKREVVAVLEQRLAAEKLNTARKEEAKVLDEWRKEQERTLDVQRKAVAQAEEEGRMLQQQMADYGLTREELAKLTGARLRDGAAALRQQALMQELNPDAVQYVRVLDEQATQLERNADAKDALARRDEEAVNRAKRERQDPDAGAAHAVREYREELANMGDAMNGLVGGSLRNLETGLTDLFTNGKFDAKSFIDTMLREFTRLTVVKPLMSSLLGGGMGGAGSGGLGGFAGMLGSFLGSGSVNAAGGFASAGFGSGAGFGNLDLGGFFAAGGDPPLGKASVVGERGPELFVPKSAGTILPNGALGGKSITITSAPTINIDSRSDAAQIHQMVERANAQSNKHMMEQLKAQGVM